MDSRQAQAPPRARRKREFVKNFLKKKNDRDKIAQEEEEQEAHQTLIGYPNQRRESDSKCRSPSSTRVQVSEPRSPDSEDAETWTAFIHSPTFLGQPQTTIGLSYPTPAPAQEVQPPIVAPTTIDRDDANPTTADHRSQLSFLSSGLPVSPVPEHRTPTHTPHLSAESNWEKVAVTEPPGLLSPAAQTPSGSPHIGPSPTANPFDSPRPLVPNIPSKNPYDVEDWTASKNPYEEALEIRPSDQADASPNSGPSALEVANGTNPNSPDQPSSPFAWLLSPSITTNNPFDDTQELASAQSELLEQTLSQPASSCNPFSDAQELVGTSQSTPNPPPFNRTIKTKWSRAQESARIEASKTLPIKNHFLFAHGDVPQSLETTKKVFDELLTDFITELCFEAHRSAQLSGRQKIKLDDIKFACRKNPQYLGKIEETLQKKEGIDKARKLMDANDDKITKSNVKALEEEPLGDADDDGP